MVNSATSRRKPTASRAAGQARRTTASDPGDSTAKSASNRRTAAKSDSGDSSGSSQSARTTKSPSASAKSAVKATAKPAAKPPAKPASKPATKPATTAKPASKPAAKPAGKPAAATAPASKPASKPASRPATKPASKPAAKPAAKTAGNAAGWNANELSGVEADLREQHAVLRAEYDGSMAALEDQQRVSSDNAGDDQADTGSKTFEREQEMSIAHNRLDLLTQIERALVRIEDGTYGLCESCGNPIAKPRLQAFPSATLCVECKQRQERR